MPIGDNAADALPVREVLNRLKEYIKRLPAIWVEGQLAEVKDRPGSSVIFATLRDLETDGSLSTSSVRAALKDDVQHLKDGDRVLMLLQPEIWPRRGELQMRVLAIKPVGIGELLVKLEALKQKLLAEGLFAPDAKQPIPFLPIKIGLVCGRASAALTDVLVNARNRWPTVEFEIREVAVQGVDAVKEVSAALIELEQDSKVDVIIVARGGGSLEDLLPFSDESLVRLVASLKTPIISAIGHEQDFPLLDFVADLRASTPTDAARRVVPDLEDEMDFIDDLVSQLNHQFNSILRDQRSVLIELQSNLIQLHPKTQTLMNRNLIRDFRYQMRTHVRADLSLARTELSSAAGAIRALSPQGTLERGYAVVRAASGSLITKPPVAGSKLKIKVAEGEFNATSGE